jgi:hypothetical protein
LINKTIGDLVMARLSFLVGFKGQDPSEKPADASKENLKGVFTCKKSVADFLGISTKVYVPSGVNVVPRKEYTKSVMKSVSGAPPAYTVITVAAGEVVYSPDSSARAKTVILKTGAKGVKAYRTLSLTFPSNMTVSQIGEALAEYIPTSTIQTTAGAPSATEIFPQYTIKGGRTYPLMAKAAAKTSTSVTAPETPAEQTAVVILTK